MVTPRSGKPRGRPPKSFRDDDDRFAVALLDALEILTNSTGRDRARAVARLVIGTEIKPPPSPSKNHPELVATTWDKLSVPGLAASFEGKADTLRVKHHKWRSDPAWEPWRQTIVHAFLIVFREQDGAIAKAQSLWLASSVGEEKFAREVLWPMIAAGDLPEFRNHTERFAGDK
jgi:hypothetical protein